MAEQFIIEEIASGPKRRFGAVAAMAAWLAHEQERWLLWVPVAMGLGVVGYFALPREPAPWLAPGSLIVLAGLAWGQRRRPGAFIAMLAVALAALGFAAAQFRVARVDAPALAREIGPLPVVGRVVEIDRLERGVRVVLDGVRLERRGLTGPLRVRVRLAGGGPAPPIGAWVQVKAVLQPRPPPASPDSFDFGRQLYFSGIGAVGYATSSARIVSDAPERFGAEIALAAESLRQHVNDRVASHLAGAEAGIAIALLTGEQTGIPQRAIAAMRDSGLAHLLSISGLHIGLVAGLVFFVVRAALALAPPLALYYPIKKWAAVAALAVAGGYTFLVGAPVPTQRALLMSGLVLFAVLVDRNPLSLRLVAFAATVILLIAPESLLGASFQMSFAAVVALIAGYEWFGVRWSAWRAEAGPIGRLGLYLLGVAATSVLAGGATLPFALYHFQQIQIYGVFANMLAVPLASFWIMPMGLLACAGLPFGLEAWPLAGMGWGIGAMLAVASWVAALPGATRLLPAMPVWGFGMVVLGGLWLALWASRPRWIGAGLAALGCVSVALASRPDLLVSGDGKLVALRDADGDLLLSTRRAGRFAAGIWLRRNGQERADAWPGDGIESGGPVRCDPLGCLWRRPDGRLVAIARDREALVEDCRNAEVVVSLVPAGRCPAPLVVDALDLWREGTHALYFEGGGIRIETVRAARGQRPWIPGDAGQ